MSSQPTELFSQAELSLSAYATLSMGASADQAGALADSGMSLKEAQEFSRRYPYIVTQYDDAVTSFSATVFRDVDGNLSLAFRGTKEFLGDVVETDADIYSYGAGYDQIVAMYNWWNRVSTPAGQAVRQYEIRALLDGLDTVPNGAVLLHRKPASGPVDYDKSYYLVESAAVTATGEMAANLSEDSDHCLNVSGHSLGGHLAMAFGVLFGNVTKQVTVFNAPGFTTTSQNEAFFAELGGSVPAGINTTNVIADEASVGDVPWTAIVGLHSRPGIPVDVAIENQWLSDEADPPSARNHSIQTLTDSLAVYATLSQLDPTLTEQGFKSILGSAALGTAASLERVTDALETLFSLNSDALVAGNANRDLLYQAIYGIQASSGFALAAQSAVFAKVVPLAGYGAAQMVESALHDIAFRYALVSLSPFAIVTPDDALYAPHNTDGHLRANQFTHQYLEDRARVLERLLMRNTKDSAFVPVFDGSKEYYADLASGISASTVVTPISPDPVIPDDAVRYIFGDSSDNSIRDSKGTDLFEPR